VLIFNAVREPLAAITRRWIGFSDRRFAGAKDDAKSIAGGANIKLRAI
jgi:hypothetical protein